MGPVASPENGSASGLGVSDLPDLPKRSSYTLAPGRPSPGSSYPPASPLRFPSTGRRGSVPRTGNLPTPSRVRDWRDRGGTGISTGLPSPTPLGLGLGPD